MLGFLSFFFDLENFTDRIMVVLTTLLVIATITATIQQVYTIKMISATGCFILDFFFRDYQELHTTK